MTTANLLNRVTTAQIQTQNLTDDIKAQQLELSDEELKALAGGWDFAFVDTPMNF